MKLTPDLKKRIDAMTYEQLLRKWRFSPAGGDPMFQGDAGDYYAKVMGEKRAANPGGAVAASKSVGWGAR